jgi:hypothetical protein
MKWLALVVALILCPRPAWAAVERYAVILGNDVGVAGETPLRYAEADGAKVQAVLEELGGYAPENVIRLAGKDAAAARRALIAQNDRIRRARGQTMLFVYYSGHADARGLHMAGSELPLVELEQLVSGSAATFRLLVLDACRSGALTRVKGGKPVAPFALRLDDRLAGEGVVFLTASASHEDAQESDALRGSFFTHYLVSGLLGAADHDGDGRVTLAEAYAHAYDSTLRASSRTLAGPQHPTFSYQLKGTGDVVLTAPGEARARARLRFPGGRGYLLLRDGPDGAVVAELAAGDGARTLSVAPGRYFVRGRGADHLLEGRVHVASGETREVRDGELERIAYARLVRKGGEPSSWSLAAGGRMRGELSPGTGACLGGYVGAELARPHYTLGARLAGCGGGFANVHVDVQTRELDLELRLSHTWDLHRLSVDLGVVGGAAVLSQRFTTAGRAPPRDSLAGRAGVWLGLGLELSARLSVTADATLESQIYRQLEVEEGREALGVDPAWRAAIGLLARL